MKELRKVGIMFIDFGTTKDNLYIFWYIHVIKRTTYEAPLFPPEISYKIPVYRIRPQNCRGTGFESTHVEI